MSQRAGSDEDRRARLSAARTVSRYLDEWDPIPVYDDTGEAPPHGEYDDLIWPVLRLLEDGASAEDLAAHLRAALQAQYGIVGPPTTLAFAQRLLAWWDEGEGVR